MSGRLCGLYMAIILGTACFIFFLCIFGVSIKGDWGEHTTIARRALLESLSISSLALTSECSSARNPSEGFCNSAGDIPGGYPYHTSCDVINPPKILQQQLFNIKVTKAVDSARQKTSLHLY